MSTTFFAHIGEIADLYKNKISDISYLDSQYPEMKDWYLAHQQIKIHELKPYIFASTLRKHIVVKFSTTQIAFQLIDAVLLRFLANTDGAEAIDFRIRLITDQQLFSDPYIPVFQLSFLNENDNLTKFNDAWKSIIKEHLPPYHPLLKDSHHG